LLIPNKGIAGIPIVIDSSNISDVIKIFGTDYIFPENAIINTYIYDKIGLTFQINPYDKNKIVRSIAVESPFKAKTENGIILNESRMKDVWNVYNSNGCIVSESYAYHTQKGISFYINIDTNNKGYDTNQLIYKIEINNNGNYGFPSNVNFEFNDEPLQNKLNILIAILKADSFNIDSLESFWNKEKVTRNKPYGLKKQMEFIRKIENNLTQYYIEFWIVGNSYYLNIITYANELIYLKLIKNEEQSIILFERIENPQYVDMDFDFYIYGTFCSMGGSPPVKCREMLDLVKNRNYNKLASWLKSINPEVATYGYIGIEFLKKKGIEIAQTESERMVELSKSNIQLYTCQGCDFGVTKKMKDELTKVNLKQIYRSFEQTGFFK